MRRTANLGLLLLLVIAFAANGLAQQDIKWKGTEDYNAYMNVYNEKDFAKKAANGEKFLADFKDADPTARQNAYVMMTISYAQGGNWAKALESVDKMSTLGPTLDASTKKQFLIVGLSAASTLKNTAKTKEYAEKVLAVDPNEVNALITLSSLLANNLPTDDAGKNAQITQALEVTNRALKQTRPANVPDAVWNPIQLQLHRTACLMLLNQKKYEETIAACREALKIDKKDGDSYYLIGLASKPELVELVNHYNASIDKLNENRTADQITRDELKSIADGNEKRASDKKDEIVGYFATAVAAGGGASAQAKDELMKLFTGTPDELNALIAAKKSELG